MTLLIDADDTLWENIRVFNDVNLAFAQWVSPHAPDELIEFADGVQREMVGVHGYGAATFRLSLLESLRRHRGSEPDHDDHARVDQLVEPFRWHSVDLLPRVEHTLTTLGERNELVLMTKGAHDEQQQKLEVSGLRSLFDHVHIVPEKTPDAYVQVVSDLGVDAGTSWMIGNSPRSDIQPALIAGLGAVHIPHADTWGHEEGEVPAHERLLVLDSFAELVHHF